ncbi:hypothetical protein [Citreicoccus inhibens]|nr:hypothetical protein [Citreicoccus inhibens]
MAACLARDAEMLERMVSRLQAHHGLRQQGGEGLPERRRPG